MKKRVTRLIRRSICGIGVDPPAHRWYAIRGKTSAAGTLSSRVAVSLHLCSLRGRSLHLQPCQRSRLLFHVSKRHILRVHSGPEQLSAVRLVDGDAKSVDRTASADGTEGKRNSIPSWV